jgi:hypothetical protein
MVKFYKNLAHSNGAQNMAARKMFRWLALLALALWFFIGCAGGVIFQKVGEDGSVDRLRIDNAGGWGDYNTTPRYRSQKPKDQDGYGLIMKNEAIF